MYVFPDKKNRLLSLRPEGTATIQGIAPQLPQNAKLFYVTDCFRYERSQKGRYRQFMQIGVEIVNPTQDYQEQLIDLGAKLVSLFASNYSINKSARRGLAYYLTSGFEISIPTLGTQSQVLGGGRYVEGIGFAIGLDRLLLAK